MSVNGQFRCACARNGPEICTKRQKTAAHRLKHVIFVHKSGSNIEYCGLESIKVCMKMKKRPRKAQKAVKSAEMGQYRQKSIICYHDF